MFLGTYNHSLDAKNRLTIPSKIIQMLGCSSIVVSKGFDGCLEIRTQESFKQYAESLMSLSQNKLKTRTILRQLLANAAELEIDVANRILLPANLMQEAKLSKEVVIIGLGNKLEIWDASLYAKFKNESDGELEALAENLEDEKI